jgi:hypothetical protein
VLLAGSAVAQEVDSGVDPETDPKAWEEYEDAAKQAGAGETVAMPGDAGWGKPWKQMCASNDDWCPNIADGVNSGLQWCTSPKCMNNHRNGSYAIYVEWSAWIEVDCGAVDGFGQPGFWPAQTMRTESFGDVFGMTKSGTKECGLASVDREHAAQLNINACDPRANIYATCWYRNNRLIALREKMPEVIVAPLEDQWLIAGAGGSVGLGKVILLLQRSNALATDVNGDLKHDHPYEYMIRYLQTLHAKWNNAQKVNKLTKSMGINGALGQLGYTEKQWGYLKKFLDLYKKQGEWSSIFGFRPGRTAFRIARPGRVAEIVAPLYYGTIPWGEPKLPERPKGITEYPGDKLHCACGNWPELKTKKPSAAQTQAVAAVLPAAAVPFDPAALICETKKNTLVCAHPKLPTGTYPGGG